MAAHIIYCIIKSEFMTEECIRKIFMLYHHVAFIVLNSFRNMDKVGLFCGQTSNIHTLKWYKKKFKEDYYEFFSCAKL